MLSVARDQVLTRDRVRISLTRYHSPDRGQALIVCPGFFQSKETTTFRRLSHALAQYYDVVAMDFRGHGRSEGWYTFSTRERADLDAVLDWTAARYPRVGVIGFSLGAAIAIQAISRRPQAICSLVAVSGPSAFDRIEFKFWRPDALRNGWKGMEPGAGCRPGPVWLPKERPVERIAACRGVPIQIVHGTRDVIVGVEHAHRLFPAAAEPKALEIVPDGSHAQAMFRDDPDDFLGRVVPWLARTLGTW